MQTENENSTTKLLEMYEYQKILYVLCKEKYPGLITIAKLLLKRAQNNYDNHVAIEGITGSGKSMFALIIIMLMHYISKVKYSIENQTLFIPDEGELKKTIGGLKPLAVYWIDEAIRALDKKRWWAADQIELNHIIKTERWKRNTIIYCMPEFMEFSNSFRTSNIHFRIYIVPRFAAVLNIKDIDKDIEDPWHTRKNVKIKYERRRNNNWSYYHYNAVIENPKRLQNERKLPNYFTDSPWPNIEEHETLKEVWEHYQRMKEQSRADFREKMEQTKEDKVMTKYDKKFKIAYAKKIVKQFEFEKLDGVTKKKIWEDEGKPCSWNTWLGLWRLESDTSS